MLFGGEGGMGLGLTGTRQAGTGQDRLRDVHEKRW